MDHVLLGLGMIPAVLTSPYPAITSSGDEGKTRFAPSEAANFMPSSNSAGRRLSPPNHPNSLDKDYLRQRPMLASSRLAPSTITTERALEARALMMPEFRHNVMATRLERISNMLADAPRFSNHLEILA